MSTHNIRFYGELTKIILQLSSNSLLIYSTGNYKKPQTKSHISGPLSGSTVAFDRSQKYDAKVPFLMRWLILDLSVDGRLIRVDINMEKSRKLEYFSRSLKSEFCKMVRVLNTKKIREKSGNFMILALAVADVHFK